MHQTCYFVSIKDEMKVFEKKLRWNELSTMSGDDFEVLIKTVSRLDIKIFIYKDIKCIGNVWFNQYGWHTI